MHAVLADGSPAVIPAVLSAAAVIIGAVAAAFSAIAVAKINKTGRELTATTAVAVQARDNAEPVSSGFTGATTALLERIHEDVQAIKRDQIADRQLLTNHLADHARAQLGSWDDDVPTQRRRSRRN